MIFDKTINLANVITIICVLSSTLATTILSFYSLDKRVVILEEARSAQRSYQMLQENTVKEKLDFISRNLEKLSDKVDRLGDK